MVPISPETSHLLTGRSSLSVPHLASRLSALSSRRFNFKFSRSKPDIGFLKIVDQQALGVLAIPVKLFHCIIFTDGYAQRLQIKRCEVCNRLRQIPQILSQRFRVGTCKGKHKRASSVHFLPVFFNFFNKYLSFI